MHIVLLHGSGGTAATMAPLAEGLAELLADRSPPITVDAVTLPGHGGVPDDVEHVTWADLLTAIPAEATVLVGQSIGASLALAAAAERPQVRAVVAVNPLAFDPDALDALAWMSERGRTSIDIPPSSVGEVAYDRLPISFLLSVHDALAAGSLSNVGCPLLLVTSADDDTIDPAHSDVVAASVSGPVRRVTLDDGGHVASLGPRAADIASAIADFVTSIDGVGGAHLEDSGDAV